MEEGKILFEKVLTASSLPPFRQMILPAWFVHEHGDKIHQTVTLRNAEIGKTWTLKINVNFPHRRPQALFCEGWRAFAVANNLAVGDRLTFVLVARSSFDVFIFPSNRNSTLSVIKRKLRSHATHEETETTISPRPQLGCDNSANGGENSEVTSSGPSFAKEIKEETKEENAIEAQAPASSERPSDIDSRFIDSEKKQACIICQVALMEKSGVIKVDEDLHVPQTKIDDQ